VRFLAYGGETLPLQGAPHARLPKATPSPALRGRGQRGAPIVPL
jgi:hypothetical protein